MQAIRSSRLQHFPISFFSMIMGLTGFAIVVQKTTSLVAGLDTLAWGTLGLASTLFVGFVGLYGYKLVTFPEEVVKEWRHPTRLAFFPTVSISLLLLSVAWLPYARALSLGLWAAGASLHLVFTLAILSTWIQRTHFEVNHLSPAWFIPVVGNILVPIAGVAHVHPEISWFFFSIGLVFWILLFTLFFLRLVFHHPLPAKLVPTLFILIAPPAVGTISALKLMGEWNDFTRVLYDTALFLFVLLMTQVRLFTKVPFFLSWWAYSFPWAALTIASLAVYHQTQALGFLVIAGVLGAGLTVLVAILLVRTIQAVVRRQICVPEE